MPDLDSTTIDSNNDTPVQPPSPVASSAGTKAQKAAARKAAAAAESEEAAADKRARRAAQNRLNAEKSTGPKSPEGKSRSRGNAIKHGLKNRVAHGVKERNEVHRMMHLLQQDYQPVGELEFQAIDRLAVNQHRTLSINQQISTLEHYFASQTDDVPKDCNITGRVTLFGDDHPERVHRLDLLYRYRRENNRDWRDNTGMLLRLQRARKIDRREEAAEERRRRRDQYDAHFRNSYNNTIRSRRNEQHWDPEDPHNCKLEKIERDGRPAREEEWRKSKEEYDRWIAQKEQRKRDAEKQRAELEALLTEEKTPIRPNEPSQPEPNQPLTPDTPPQN